MLAVKVISLVPVAPGAVNSTVTPLGSPNAENVTPLLKPFCEVTVTIPAADAPRGNPRLAGRRDSVKFGSVMVSTMVVVLVSGPETPVTVTVAIVAVAVPALKVRVLLPVVLDGLKVAVTPLGKPDTPKATVPLKPFLPITLMVLLLLPARGTVTLPAEEVRLKLGITTVNAMVVVLFRLPAAPVMVSG